MLPSQTELKALFLGALDRPVGPDRAAYLDDACRGEASVRAQVEELLEAHERAGIFLTSTAQTTTGDDTNTAMREATAPPTAVLTQRDDVRSRRLGRDRESLGRHDWLESENPARARRGDPRPGLHSRQPSRGSWDRTG